MKNLLKIEALELNENDNGYTAFAKGGAKGIIKMTLLNCVIVGVVAIIGKSKQRNKSISEEVGE